MAQLKDSLVQGSMRVTDTLYANALNTVKIDTSGDITLISASGDSPSLIFDRGSTSTDWRLIVTSGKLSFQSRTGTNAFTERGSFGDNNGAFSASTFNGLTLTAATTGFTIAGGTTSKTLTVSESITLKAGAASKLAWYSTANNIQGARNAYLIDESGDSVKNKRNELVLGNASASTANGSSFGRLALYSENTAGTYLVSASGTAWKTATLQAKDGTIAYTSDITATAVGLGNVENTKLSTWTGSSNITTVGTISSGTWQGTAIASDYIGSHTHSYAGSSSAGGAATSANALNFVHTNEILIGNTNAQAAIHINHRRVNGGATSGNTAITGYYFKNGNGAVTGVTVYAAAFNGSLTGNASSATKIAAKLAATTKTYLLGTSTTITGTAANVDLIGDTGVYLTTTNGELSAVKYSINSSGTEKVNLQYDTTTDILNFVFV